VYAGGDPVGQRGQSGLACIGGSVYVVFGGGSLCITDEGLSLCAEAGTDLDIDPSGDLADSGTSAIAEAKAKFGPVQGKLSAELDSSGCLSGGPELELGPIKITPDDVKAKLDIDAGRRRPPETTARDAPTTR
jgi:hypothetical protein